MAGPVWGTATSGAATPTAPTVGGGRGPTWGSTTSTATSGGGGKKPGGVLGFIHDVGNVIGGGSHWIAQKSAKAGADIAGGPGFFVKETGDFIHSPTLLTAPGGWHGLAQQYLHPFKPVKGDKLATDVQGQVRGGIHALKHPGDDPFATAMTAALLASGGASAFARGSYAVRAAGAAREAAPVEPAARVFVAHPTEGTVETPVTTKAPSYGRAAAKAVVSPFHKPPTAARPIRLGDSGSIGLHPSSNPAWRLVQAGYDHVIQKAIDNNIEGRVAAHGIRRVHGATLEQSRRATGMRKVVPAMIGRAAAGARVGRLGVPRAVAEAALRLTTINRTPELAQAFHAERALGGDVGQTAVNHAQWADLFKKVSDLGVVTKDEHGNVVIDSTKYPRLAALDKAVARAQDKVDEIAVQHGLMTAEQLAAGRNNPGRVYSGAHYVSEQDAAAAARGEGLIGQEREAVVTRQGREDVLNVGRAAQTADVAASRAERTAFRAGTQRTAAEQEALRASQLANRMAERASITRATHGERAVAGEAARGLLQREQRLAQITYQRFQRGEVGPGVLNRAQERLGRITDQYERNAGAVSKVRTAATTGFQAVKAQEENLGRLRETERAAQAEHEAATAHAAQLRGQQQTLSSHGDVMKRISTARVARVRAETERRMGEQLARAGRFVGDEGLAPVTAVRAARDEVNQLQAIHNDAVTKAASAAPRPPRAHPERPASPTRVEQTHAALEAAQKRLAELEAQQEPGPAGRGYTSYATRQAAPSRNLFARAAGPVFGRRRNPMQTKAFTGSGIEHGLIPDDVSRLNREHVHQMLRYVTGGELRRMAIETGSNMRRSSRDVLMQLPHVSTEKLDAETENLLGKTHSTLNQVDEHTTAIMEGLKPWLHDLLPDMGHGFSRDKQTPLDTSASEAAAARGLESPNGYTWVDRNMVKSLEQIANHPGFTGSALNTVNSAITAATVYFKIGHLLTRTATNAFTNLTQGALEPTEIGRSVKLWKSLSKEDQMRALAASGGHGMAAMPHEGTNWIARTAGWGARQWALRVDAPFRFNAIAYEARRAGYDTPKQFTDLLYKLENPHTTHMSAAERSRAMGVANRANREAMSYDRMNDKELTTLARVLWFYPWTKTAVRFAGHTVVEHPYKAAALASMGVQGRQLHENVFGKTADWAGSLIKLGGGRTTNLGSLTPFETSAQVADMIARPTEIGGQANPAYAALLTATTGLKQTGGMSKTPIGDALSELFAPTPEAQVYSAWAHPKGPNAVFHRSPLQAFYRSLVGPTMPQKTNFPALNRAYGLQQSGR